MRPSVPFNAAYRANRSRQRKNKCPLLHRVVWSLLLHLDLAAEETLAAVWFCISYSSYYVLITIKKVFNSILVLPTSPHRDMISLQQHCDRAVFEHEGAAGAVQSTAVMTHSGEKKGWKRPHKICTSASQATCRRDTISDMKSRWPQFCCSAASHHERYSTRH